jgi:hypothetical protein
MFMGVFCWQCDKESSKMWAGCRHGHKTGVARMTNAQIMQRIEKIERELERIKLQLQGRKQDNDWLAMSGTFANDPLFEKAMRYGRQYRRSLQPKAVKKRKRSKS